MTAPAPTVDQAQLDQENTAQDSDRASVLPLREPERRVEAPRPVSQPSESPESPQAAAERQKRYRQIMGYPEPKRRRWRR